MVHEVRKARRVRRVVTFAATMSTAAMIGAAGSGAQSSPRDATPKRVAEAAMVKADRDFNQAVADRNLERFLSLVAADAAFNEARGREAVRKAWAPFFAADGPRLSWAPTKAEALVGGDVGYTIGNWERKAKGADGAVKTTHGQYLTVWQKQKDGSWQAAYDTGSTAP
jgi:ketosteroid isomerase-like protein